MTMQQEYVQVVSVALVQCKQHTILNRMVKAAQLMLGGFFYVYALSQNSHIILEI